MLNTLKTLNIALTVNIYYELNHTLSKQKYENEPENYIIKDIKKYDYHEDIRPMSSMSQMDISLATSRIWNVTDKQNRWIHQT